MLFCVFSLLHQGEEEVEMSSTELLYQGILPSLPQYMVSAVCGLLYAQFTLRYDGHIVVYTAKSSCELILRKSNHTKQYIVPYSFVMWHVL